MIELKTTKFLKKVVKQVEDDQRKLRKGFLNLLRDWILIKK